MWRMYASTPLFIHVFKSLEAIVRSAAQLILQIDYDGGDGTGGGGGDDDGSSSSSVGGGNVPIKYVLNNTQNDRERKSNIFEMGKVT